MNDNLHPIFQRALAPFTPLDVEPIKGGGTLLEPVNDGELTQADLEAIDSAMHIDKLGDGYERRRVEVAAKLERDSALFRDGR